MKPWLDSYPADVPPTIDPDTHASVTSLFNDAIKRFPEHAALECFGHTMTYGQLDEASDALASALQQQYEVKKGDRIAVMLPNIFAYPVAMLAILKVGAIQVNVNPLYTSRELEHQLNDSGAETMFIYSGSVASLTPIRDATSVSQVIVVNPGDGAGLPIPGGDIPAELGEFTGMADLLAHNTGNKPTAVPVSGDDVLFLQYTGGTTGPSKGATLTHRNLVANSLQFRSFIPEANEPGEEVLVLALPMYHIFGLMIFVAYAAIGAKAILIPNPRDMDAYLKAIKDSGFTVIGGVNTLYAGMTQHPLFKDVDLSRYKVAFGGGSKIFPSTSKAWKAFTGAHILEGFGLSETSPILTLNLMGQEAFSGTVGYPVPSTEVKIIDEQGNALPAGTPGELCARGPQVMKGYWNRGQATADTFTEDGFFKTGDVAVMHPDGQFEIVDRKKDMIIVSGFNVYPNEVEAVASELPEVAEAACIGVPDEKTGERIRLFVAPTEGSAIDKDAVMAHCRQSLAAYKVPKEIEVLQELPKSNVGKILRKDLRVV
ncbi:AMP-binding protein [Marinobacter arenosus]|uniref:AMP-binding protein n=1 Tax=Marinobacter arenosus TaxID=2856822 RepID=UPI001C4B982E|nr:AMP-binding protein [Marinobacter arenosus]MBW0148494.1 AMP-binding protein [Marinobacter arenosus]